jgi:protease-4
MEYGDLLLDRKRLKSHLAAWRTVALVAIFGAVAFYAGHFDKHGGGAIGTDYVAQITVDGPMGDNSDRDDLFKDVQKDNRAKALIVRMDSPGGTAVAGEELYLQLRKVSAKKPVVVVMRTVCASACYMAALGADQILAREGTLTGSIGVLLQSLEISRLADKIGVTPITIRSGPYKDVPSLTEPFREEQRKVVGEVVMDAYDHFVRLIVERRHMNEARARELADGRIYTGNQAARLQLIDGLGGNDEAKLWLAQNRKISPKLSIREIRPDEQPKPFFRVLSKLTGIDFSANTVGLDGLVSIWHPSLVH